MSAVLHDFISALVNKGCTCFNDLESIEARKLTGYILQEGETLCDLGEFLPDEFFTKVVAPTFMSDELDKEPLIYRMVVLFMKRIINYHTRYIDDLLEEEARKQRDVLNEQIRIFEREGYKE